MTRPRPAAGLAYDRLSRWYDLVAAPWERPAREAGLRQLAARGGERVLEVGCGTGHNLVALARAVGPAGHVYGLDLSRRMLGVARGRLERMGLVDRVSLIGGDAVCLPWQGQALDAVLLSFTLELLDTPDIALALAECARVLRQGGRITVVALSKAGAPNRLRDLYEWGHLRFPQFLDCRPIYARRALEQAGAAGAWRRIVAATTISLGGLPVEVVTAM